jgi:molybdenum cofactor cytidylyltransferase
VLFARPLFERFLALDGDEGARSILSSLGARLVEIPCPDPGILLDVDRPIDLDGA